MQADVLDRRPDNREATTLRGEHINLIGALPYIAEETLNGIRRLNMPMHALQELAKRSTGALHPQSSSARLLDNACCTWL